jgi:beta-lactamase class A
MSPVRRLLGGSIVVALLAAGLLPAAPPAGAAPTAPCAPSVFPASFSERLAKRYPGRGVTAAVHDTRSGCWYHLHPGRRITTASVIKAHVLGAVLLKAQRERRGLTDWERARIDPMITYSFNSPWTSDLYTHAGGAPGMAELDRLVGATSTSHTRVYGATVSTAADRTKVALALFGHASPLGDQARAEAWRYMTAVHPTQRWGITAGVPLGWTVAMKNGFYPSSDAGWRLGSTGFVRRDGTDQGYAITVLTDRNPDHASGQRLVEQVSRRVAAQLTVGPQARRPVDRSRCTATSAGERWEDAAARLGLPASSAGAVRTVSGGNPSPLQGQRACAPTLRASTRRGSTVHGHYLPVVTDLDCDGRDDIIWYGRGTAPDAVWHGRANRRFRYAPVDVRRTYAPVAGDFDGDGCGDVLWYAPGSAPDAMWYGRRRGGPRWVRVTVSGRGYHPVSGDFDGDGRSDVLWYLPGDGTDWMWFGTRDRGRFRSARTSVLGAYEPVAGDLDGDGADDVVWYAPGKAADSVWFGRSGRPVAWRTAPVRLDRRIRPFAGDFGGDGDDGVFWYGPGAAPDRVWTNEPPDERERRVRVRRDHLPAVGDFDGDGRDDIAWYGPGGMPDAIWWGRGDARFGTGRLST